jgi:hypothetical protein
VRGIVLGLLLALLISSCVVRKIMSPRLTGTCNGACAHYVQCKAGASDADMDRCTQECPDVFSDRESLMGFESLACPDAVEYVDGTSKRTASTPSAPEPTPAVMKR